MGLLGSPGKVAGALEELAAHKPGQALKRPQCAGEVWGVVEAGGALGWSGLNNY